MKIIILGILVSIVLWAENAALFGTVVNVSQNDILNVRSQADHRSKKVGEVPPEAYAGIEKCITVKNSTWCRIYPLVQNWYDKFWKEEHIGWVNARYLKFSNRGYVIVKGEKNCAYALDCHRGKCEVIDDKKAAIKTKWIEREYLKGESNFGVTPDNVDGYCNNGMYIED